MKIQLSSGTYELQKKQFAKKGEAWTLDDEYGRPFARLSIWVPITPSLPPNVTYIKAYAENEQIVSELIRRGILTMNHDYPMIGEGFEPYYAMNVHAEPVKKEKYLEQDFPPTCFHAMDQSLVNALYTEGKELLNSYNKLHNKALKIVMNEWGLNEQDAINFIMNNE